MNWSIQILIKIVLCVQLCTAHDINGGCFDDVMDEALSLNHLLESSLSLVPIGVKIVDVFISSPLGYVIQIGKYLSDVYCKFGRFIARFALKQVTEQIEQINLQIENLGSEEKELKRESLKQLKNTKKKLEKTRTELETLATQTIEYSRELIDLIKDIDPTSTEDIIKRKIKYSAEKMIDLINRSIESLEKARQDYNHIYSNLSEVSMNIKAFRERVNRISNKASNQSEIIQEDMADWACKGSGFWVMPNPLCWVTYLGYGIWHNHEAQVLVNSYTTQKQQLDKVLQSLEPFQNHHSKLDNSINVEIQMIRDWKAKLDVMIEDFESIESLGKKIFEDKEGAILMLENLAQSCQNYVDHVKVKQSPSPNDKSLVLENLKQTCENYLQFQFSHPEGAHQDYNNLAFKHLVQSCQHYLDHVPDNKDQTNDQQLVVGNKFKRSTY